jgi:peroxiredoxin Q/BCP
MPVELAPEMPAPSFSLPRDGGGNISLGEFAGRKLVLYFYPRADTPGCTVESQAFSALRPAFEKAGTAVLGVSADPIKAQDAFKKKYGLEIPLASDETHRMMQDYGVWVEKSMYGRKYMGIERATFLIRPDGRIARVWRKVKVKGHADEVLAAAKAL